MSTFSLNILHTTGTILEKPKINFNVVKYLNVYNLHHIDTVIMELWMFLSEDL